MSRHPDTYQREAECSNDGDNDDDGGDDDDNKTCSVIGGGAVVVNNQVACCTISTTWPSVLSDQEMMRMKMRRRVRMSMRGYEDFRDYRPPGHKADMRRRTMRMRDPH